MKNLSKLKSQHIMQTAAVTEAVEFSTIFGSNLKSTWFEWLMKHSGTYLFTTALILTLIKTGILLYQFIKNPNKNINNTSSLLFNILQTALVATAIIGSLTAASVFAVVTPALFVATMTLDTLRNAGLLIWNLGKLASLRFSLRKKLNNPEDPLTRIKYEALKTKYLDHIKQHALGSIIGFFMTFAASVIFLLPHIGLGAVGAAAFTIGTIKLTVSGLAGLSAASALLIPLVPLAKQALTWALEKSGIKSFLTRLKNKEEPSEPNQPLIVEEKTVAQAPVDKKKSLAESQAATEFKIDSSEALEKSLNHQLEFSAFTQHTQLREEIIHRIETKLLALSALDKMIDAKINHLKSDINKGKHSGYHYFSELERPKREQKLFALLLIKQHLTEYDNDAIFTENRQFFKNFDRFEQKAFSDIETLIAYIDKALPGTKSSFFLQESDTQNIIAALKAYANKFEPHELEATVSLRKA